MDLESRKGKPEKAVMEKIFTWINNKGIESHFGKGKKYGTWYPQILINDDLYFLPIQFESDGAISVSFENLKFADAYKDEQKRKELLLEFNKIPGVNLPINKTENWSNFSISTLLIEENLKIFFKLYDEIIKKSYIHKTS